MTTDKTPQQRDAEMFEKVQQQHFDSDPYKVQVGGEHYQHFAIQPTEIAIRNGLSFAEGNIVKYAHRHKVKGGAEDIKKLIHYAQMILRTEYGEA